MTDALICDAIRTPIGRYGGVLAGVRTDDLAAVPLRALMSRNPSVDWSAVSNRCTAASKFLRESSTYPRAVSLG